MGLCSFYFGVFVLITFVVRGEVCADRIINTTPVIWRNSNTPLTSGNYEVILRINLINPCEILTSDIVHDSLVQEARKRCELLYKRDILDELTSMCPDYNPKEVLHREKRLILFTILIGTIIAAVVVPVGLGIAAVSMSAVNMQRISSLAEIDAQQAEQIRILTSRYNGMEHRFGNFSQDFEIYKAKSIPTQLAISNVIARFTYGRLVIRETSRQMKLRKLHPPFLDFFNYSLPCNDECPANYAKTKRCRFANGNELTMQFNVPTINKTLQLLEADPFQLMLRRNNETCRVEYTGPFNLVVSKQHDCVFPLNVKKYASQDLLLAPSDGCVQNKSKLPSGNKYFGITHCSPQKELDHLDFIQIKPYHGNNRIYCPGSTITIHGNSKPCPDTVFLLPISTSFKINNYVYDSKTVHLDHQEQLDPLYNQKANWFLSPALNMEEFHLDLDRKENIGSYYVKLVIYVAVGILVVTMIAGVIIIYLYFKSRNMIIRAVELENLRINPN